MGPIRRMGDAAVSFASVGATDASHLLHALLVLSEDGIADEGVGL